MQMRPFAKHQDRLMTIPGVNEKTAAHQSAGRRKAERTERGKTAARQSLEFRRFSLALFQAMR